MKKYISCLLVLLALVLPMFGMGAAAAETVASGACGENLTWTLDDAGTLTISGTGEMEDYDSVSAPWYAQRTMIKSLVIEDGVTGIGSYAFSDCSSLARVCYGGTEEDISLGVLNDYLEDVTWHYQCDGVTCKSTEPEETEPEITKPLPEITKPVPDTLSGTCGVNLTWTLDAAGTLTISGTGNMEHYGLMESPWYDQWGMVQFVVIEDGVTSIGGCAFNSCRSLEYVTIPDSVTEIGYYAFFGCSGLESITIPDSVTEIGDSAFSGCISLTEVIIPESVTGIGSYAFSDCSSLSEVTIGEGVIEIGDSAFSDCSSLSKVTIGEGVTEIGDFAFFDCSSLADVYITDVAAWLDIRFGYSCANPLETNGLEKKLYLEGELITHLVIPEGVTEIGSYAFYHCSSLTEVSIPASVTTINAWAFSGCSSLARVCYGGTEEDISLGVLNDYLEDATWHYQCDGVTCKSTEPEETKPEETIPEETIPEETKPVFDVSSGTCGVNLTWTLDSTGTLTISGTGAMENYDVGYYEAPWQSWNSQIEAIVVEDGVTSIGDSAFESCVSLSSITIPGSVISIGIRAFAWCGNLSSITIPAGVTTIGGWAFLGCKRLHNIAIPYSVTDIGDDAFSGCDLLSKVEITDIAAWCKIRFGRAYSNPLPYADDGLYLDGEPITEVVLPGGINSIPKDAFHNCRSLRSVTISAGVTSIGDGAFELCKSLRSITIPAGVTSIGMYAFCCCDNLHSIAIPGSVTSIGNGAFLLCENLKTVHYTGTQAQRADIWVGSSNQDFLNAAWHYECDCPKTASFFADVAEDAYYFAPVMWAVNKGITNGMDAVHFAPEGICTRGQIVTFLWRAKGSPAPVSTASPFWDVNSDDYYYKAVLWAVEKGIVSGMGNSTFAPNIGCTRGQVATLLWRAEGKPSAGRNNIFTDIDPSAYYYNAVLWAVENDITNGMGDGTFAPDATCTRGQIVTFLFRTLA